MRDYFMKMSVLRRMQDYFFLIGIVGIIGIFIPLLGCDSSSSKNAFMEMNPDQQKQDGFLLDVGTHDVGLGGVEETLDQEIQDALLPDQTPEDPLPSFDPQANPLNLLHPLYPYPSSFFLEDDPTTATGKKLSIPSEYALAGVPSEYLAQHDGFSRMPFILSLWPNGVDSENLNGLDDFHQSQSDDSLTLLIERDTLKRIPHLTEIDRSAMDPLLAPLIIRPLEVLKPNQSYIVIIQKGLKDLQGNLHQRPVAFQKLISNEPTTIPEIERVRDAFNSIRQVIEQSRLNVDQTLLAWDFHTRSNENSIHPLLKAQEIASEWPLGEWEITKDEQEGNNRQIEGLFEVPVFVGENGLEFDQEGNPKVLETALYPFTLTLPSSLNGEPRPVIVYGHGFLGNRIQSTRGSFNELCTRGRYSAFGLNFGFHEEILATAIRALTGDSASIDPLVAEVLQTMTNTSLLVRYIQSEFPQEWIELDPENVHYMGISNGGTFGYLFAATTLVIQKAVLVVGGGGLAHFLQRATQWNELGYIASSRYTTPADLQLFLGIIQSVLDPIDPINFVDHLVEPRFENRPPLQAQIHMAVHDSQVHNLVSEWVVRSAQIPVMAPSPKTIWGVEEYVTPMMPISLDEQPKGALFVYDEDVEPSPIGNIPPEEDNRTHGTVRALRAYQDHIIDFIDTGRFRLLCEGPCDPE